MALSSGSPAVRTSGDEIVIRRDQSACAQCADKRGAPLRLGNGGSSPDPDRVPRYERVVAGDHHEMRGLSARLQQESYSSVQLRTSVQRYGRRDMMTSTGKFSEYFHGLMITTVSACMIAGLAQVARASEPARSVDPPSVTVKIADLNVNTPMGLEANR